VPVGPGCKPTAHPDGGRREGIFARMPLCHFVHLREPEVNPKPSPRSPRRVRFHASPDDSARPGTCSVNAECGLNLSRRARRESDRDRSCRGGILSRWVATQ